MLHHNWLKHFNRTCLCNLENQKQVECLLKRVGADESVPKKPERKRQSCKDWQCEVGIAQRGWRACFTTACVHPCLHILGLISCLDLWIMTLSSTVIWIWKRWLVPIHTHTLSHTHTHTHECYKELSWGFKSCWRWVKMRWNQMMPLKAKQTTLDPIISYWLNINGIWYHKGQQNYRCFFWNRCLNGSLRSDITLWRGIIK